MEIEGGYTLDGNTIEYFSVPKGSLIWAIQQLIEKKTKVVLHDVEHFGVWMSLGPISEGKLLIEAPSVCKWVPLEGWKVDTPVAPKQVLRPIWSEL